MSSDGITRNIYGYTANSNHGEDTHIYYPDDETPVQLIVKPKSELITTGSGRNKNYERSTGTCYTTGYSYISVYLGSVYVTSKRLHNAHIVAPCLCYSTNENKKFYIISYIST